jgi:hypothetical protein
MALQFNDRAAGKLHTYSYSPSRNKSVYVSIEKLQWRWWWADFISNVLYICDVARHDLGHWSAE